MEVVNSKSINLFERLQKHININVLNWLTTLTFDWFIAGSFTAYLNGHSKTYSDIDIFFLKSSESLQQLNRLIWDCGQVTGKVCHHTFMVTGPGYGEAGFVSYRETRWRSYRRLCQKFHTLLGLKSLNIIVVDFDNYNHVFPHPAPQSRIVFYKSFWHQYFNYHVIESAETYKAIQLLPENQKWLEKSKDKFPPLQQFVVCSLYDICLTKIIDCDLSFQ